ncbi:unnamed protein product [Clonostachys rosea]|uniref:Uncharacterized protein n=1 Tax=Bionectria ochroleuca TaxID=29856 RepID=A0ABY6TYH5_BIOOC|nr:unnamed protein product [Clonostachys rosea]
MLLWSWANLLFFNLSNQHQEASIAEDAVNKPWRPLPSGRLSPAQAKRLFHYMYSTVIFISLTIGGTLPSLAIICLSYWYDNRGGASSPWVKNVINGLGIGFFFTGPLEVITGHSIFSGKGDGAIWVAIIMATIASTSHAQDLRDVEGDKAAGRETLPIAIGDTNARILAAIGILFWTWLACWYWRAGWTQGATAGLTGVAMSTNMFRDRTREGDIITWKFFPWWMLGIFLIPVLSQ